MKNNHNKKDMFECDTQEQREVAHDRLLAMPVGAVLNEIEEGRVIADMLLNGNGQMGFVLVAAGGIALKLMHEFQLIMEELDRQEKVVSKTSQSTFPQSQDPLLNMLNAGSPFFIKKEQGH